MTPNERRFDPANLQKLENIERAVWFPVDAILDAAGACSMLNVADVGAGTGYFTLPLARRVAPGTVFAVEPAPEMRSALTTKLQDQPAIANVKLVVGEATATGVEAGACDLIFLCAVWHELDDHTTALAEFARIAAPNAKLAIVDWRPDAPQHPGPPLAHRIHRAEVERTLEAGGWGIVKSDIVNQWDRPGSRPALTGIRISSKRCPRLRCHPERSEGPYPLHQARFSIADRHNSARLTLTPSGISSSGTAAM